MSREMVDVGMMMAALDEGEPIEQLIVCVEKGRDAAETRETFEWLVRAMELVPAARVALENARSEP